MVPIDPVGARELVEAAATAVSILGGAMASCSGYFAAQALSTRQTPSTVAHRVNEGIGEGFSWGWPIAVFTLIIELWT